ncbi:MAG: hypothetical protein IT546_06930 [Caulobacteraceae bacterium]|nr:hypothetical protein [Caulobacteraceae bacterium]
MAAITLNGTTFYPSDIEEEADKIGRELEAADGSRRFVHRANKRAWSIAFDRVPLATLTALRTIYGLTTTFAFVDENANAYTVYCPPGALSSSVGMLATEAGAQVLYYNCSRSLKQA